MRKMGLILLFSVVCVVHASEFPAVTPGKKIEFPRDAGSHDDYRIEWWYVTGHLESARGPLGFQVTFFRLRNPEADANPSRFSPKQLLFAHAALADPAKARLLADQRSARALPPLVRASESSTDVRIDDWSLARDGTGYAARVDAQDFALELALAPTQAPLLEGERGYSRKGARAGQASYYYSEPQLAVSGRVREDGRWLDVRGTAWLDHEWSSELLAREAAGWDWIGANLDGGGALMAFRIRAANGDTLWAGATLRDAGAAEKSFASSQVRFTPRRTWRSPRSGVEYPVAMRLQVADREWNIEPLLDDQELDARSSTGTLYWEGAVRIEGSGAGRAYLELTGYAGKVPF